VPRVVGALLARAKTKIRKAHCSVGRVRYKAASKKKRGRVLSQSPRPGKHLANGARVSLVVGRR
jgi:beta-lactam-binding protein with PASTA domain